jgi:hypothetical protein
VSLFPIYIHGGGGIDIGARPADVQITEQGSAEVPTITVTNSGQRPALLVEGENLDAAIDDLIDALRDYAVDWNDRLRLAVNHQENWALAAMVELSSDEQLRSWLLTFEPLTEQ